MQPGIIGLPCLFLAPNAQARRPAPADVLPFVAGIATLPAVPWGLDVDSHCQMLTASWQRVFDAVVDRPARVRKGSYLSDSTFQVVQYTV